MPANGWVDTIGHAVLGTSGIAEHFIKAALREWPCTCNDSEQCAKYPLWWPQQNNRHRPHANHLLSVGNLMGLLS